MRDSGHEVPVLLENVLRCGNTARDEKTSNVRSAHCRPPAFLYIALSLLASFTLPAWAGSANGTYASSTFINSGLPNNNNGGASEIYIGNDFENESLRGLVRFSLTGSLSTRATVTAASVTMTTGTLAGSSPVAATVSLYRVLSSWGQGSGDGVDVSGDHTQGAPCSPGGATWNSPSCSGATWSFSGASASASVPATSGYSVTWNSTTSLVSDVQGWIDGTTGNYGWLLFSSTETTYDSMQPFIKNGQLNFSFACKPGFLDTGTSCSACTAAAQTACVTSQAGNACVDPGPPSGYHCSCGNPAYTGTGTDSCLYVTTTGVTSSPSTSTAFGQSVTFTASVTGSSPSGTVDFLDGAATLCSGVVLASNQAACTPASPLSVGSHSIQANYSGDTANTLSTGSLTQTVDQATSTTALTTQCLLTFVEDQPFTMTATVNGVDPTGNVDFSDGSSTLCGNVALSSGAADCTTSTLSVPSGTQYTYQLTANYGGDGDNATSLSGPLAITVLSAADVVFRDGFETATPSCPIE